MIFKISVRVFEVQHCTILCNLSFCNVSVCLTLFPSLSCLLFLFQSGKGLFSSDPIWIMSGAICLSTLCAAFSGNRDSNTVQLSFCCPQFFCALFPWPAFLAHCFAIILRPDTFYLRLLLLIFFFLFLSPAGLNPSSLFLYYFLHPQTHRAHGTPGRLERQERTSDSGAGRTGFRAGGPSATCPGPRGGSAEGQEEHEQAEERLISTALGKKDRGITTSCLLFHWKSWFGSSLFIDIALQLWNSEILFCQSWKTWRIQSSLDSSIFRKMKSYSLP